MPKLNSLKSHWPKILATCLFLLLIGSYVKIFAIGSPYAPGATFDPECPPGEINCTVLITSGGTSLWTESGSDIYFDTGNVGIGTNAPTSKLEINLSSNITYHQAFLGGGLDDAIFSGSYESSIPNSFYITIIEEGSPDIFEFYDTKGICDSQYATQITGSPQLLCDDVYVTFSSISGHTLYDSWEYNIDNNLSEGGRILSIKDNIDNYFVVNAIARDSNFLGDDAGINATGAFYSNFLGKNSGYGSALGEYSNFLGKDSGFNAVNANNSNFLGQYSGYTATNANNSNFLGQYSGYTATNANNSNFLGYRSGMFGTSASYSNFFGTTAGYGSNNAKYSNFLGNSAGWGASSAQYSNFIGSSAGYQATGASNSNFIGSSSGSGATYANNSNFLGTLAGQYSTQSYNSNFIGTEAGAGFHWQSSGSAYANFIGYRAGQYTMSASNSNFIGNYAGHGSGYAPRSNFIGDYAGYTVGTDEDGYFSDSNFIGSSAGSLAINAAYSNFFGAISGYEATNATYSNFLGYESGYQATNATNSNFFGYQSGYGATNATGSNFFGAGSGYQAANASYSNFFGASAGKSAVNASYSNFFGVYAGRDTNASNSNFFGYRAGWQAFNASNSNFIGPYSGQEAYNASNSIFIGQNAGYQDLVNNTGSADHFSILIGKSTGTGGFSNSIALGGSAVNTASNQFMIGSTIRPINTTVFQGTTTECTITTGTGIACTSDERMKDNITDLSNDTLAKLMEVRTINFNWKDGDVDINNIGFIAQDLEKYFPELVSTNKEGYKSVYYANMTPILVEALREMNLKVNDFSSLDTNSNKSLGYLIKKFIEDESNFFNKIFTKTVVTEGIEMKDITTGEPYCVVITNGEFKNIKGKCGEPVSIEEPAEEPVGVDEDEIIIEDENTNDDQDETIIIIEEEKEEEAVFDILNKEVIIEKTEKNINSEESFQIENEKVNS